MIVVLDQRQLTHKKTSPIHSKYGLHMLQNGGTVQFYRTVDTDLPKLCTAQLRRHHREEYRRSSTGDKDSLTLFQLVYRHDDGTLFADTFGDDQWGFPSGTITDPTTYASLEIENFGTTFADDHSVFGATVPTPDGKERILMNVLLSKVCT